MTTIYYGECQLCGKTNQKLVGGKIDYHVNHHGDWDVLCEGSRRLPLEQSCDMLAGTRATVLTKVDFMRRQVTQYEMYAEWLDKRLKDWTPKELRPIEDDSHQRLEVEK